MAKKIPVFEAEPSHPWLYFVKPTSAGVLVAALVAFYPQIINGDMRESEAVAASGMFGFLLGYAFFRAMDSLRIRALRVLLTYTDWMFDGHSMKTKIWAYLLNMLKRPGPHKTYEFQDVIPSLPLPNLNETLDKWLAVSNELMSEEEMQTARENVEQFSRHEGPILQEYLSKRCLGKRNWLAEYWTGLAYLSSRDPIALKSNFYFIDVLPEARCKDPLARAANKIYATARFAQFVADERLVTQELQGLVPLCMETYKYLFGSVRHPGQYMDSIKTYSASEHIVVIRKGHYFKLNVYTMGEMGKKRVLSRAELYRALKNIVNSAEAMEAILPVGVLTAQKRDKWFTSRQKLEEQNFEVLKAVESALFMAILDDEKPKNGSALALESLAGTPGMRWYDKSVSLLLFENSKFGCNVEHAISDGATLAILGDYCLAVETYSSEGLLKCDQPQYNELVLVRAEYLEWDLECVKSDIEVAAYEYNKLRDDVHHISHSSRYGKEYMKKKRLSPDGYVQMAMQLAYYRVHKETPKTYEPALTRMYAQGRTDTVHPVSEHSTCWVRAMDDPTLSDGDKVKMLRAAIKTQTSRRLEATAGKGHERHLLGLYCASRELGMDLPRLFTDKAFTMGYRLSTSQVLVQWAFWGLDILNTECGGGFAAACQDGYGITYPATSEDHFTFHISTWRSCKDTDSKTFAVELDQAFDDMKDILSC